MPTISVSRDLLFAKIERIFTDEEFDDLCFEFGIELDDVTSEKTILQKEHGGSEVRSDASEEILYKIEIPANRYDLLCVEGLSKALRIFLGLQKPNLRYRVDPPTFKITVSSAVQSIRPFVVGAILRNITLDQHAYDSFIAFQDKLHSNICRKRTLVAIGTHDLDRISAKGDICYDALPPDCISFVPLKEKESFRGDELMLHYEKDHYLKHYLHIIRNSPVYPVIIDGGSNRRILSMPPIINSEHSKVTTSTRNILIEITATDMTKANIVLNVLVCAFFGYCEQPCSVEQVSIEYEADRNEQKIPLSHCTPTLATRTETVSLEYMNRCIGVKMTLEELKTVLGKMGYETCPNVESSDDQSSLIVTIPADRSDVLHLCDIMEDAAIGYGFNNVEKTMPITSTVGAEFSLNKLTDALRIEIALAGFTECSNNENFSHINKSDLKDEAVVLANPQTVEFEVVRTSLLPGLLKTVSSNKFMPLPIKIFEIADVSLLDEKSDVGARNERRLCALIADTTSGLEVIHGLVDRLMLMLNISRSSTDGFSVKSSKNPTYFPDRQAEIFYKGRLIGSFGIIHPACLEKFEIPFVSSSVEINIEYFL